MTGFNPAALRAVTFDFGNTLVPVGAAGLGGVVEATGRAVVDRLGPFDFDDYERVWAAERDRQFREEVPEFRETDLGHRFVRVLARLRGMPAPPDDVRWDQDAAARNSTPEEIAWALEVYSQAFVEQLPPDPAAGPLLEGLASRVDVGILSNWPFAATIDRYAEAMGWSPLLRAVVVSQRVGVIKPHPGFFQAARAALGDPEPGTILHVGDDWAADVVGAAAAGWLVAYLDNRPADSPLPSSQRDGRVVPDVELASLADLGAVLRLGRSPNAGIAGTAAAG
ncbi:MAG: HAD family hydrolase [Chloroflexota bacterium]